MDNAQSDTFKIFLCSIHYFIHVGKMLAKLSKCREGIGKMYAKYTENFGKIFLAICRKNFGRMLVKCRENVGKMLVKSLEKVGKIQGKKNVCKMLAKSQEKVGKIQGRCWEIVGKMSAKYCKNISKKLSTYMMQGKYWQNF